MNTPGMPDKSATEFDNSSHKEFVDYYDRASLSASTARRFASIAEMVLRVSGISAQARSVDVIDIGCGAGMQSRFWADKGHRYVGLDVNEPLIQIARERAAAEGLQVRFEVGSGTGLPFPDASFDVCLLPELLEHIADWQTCLNEAIRVLRPGGTIYVSTTSWLCPKQQEFNLVGYGWYPNFVKRYFERRAVTDWPAVANFARYPAVHWFSYYQLRRYFGARGLQSFDRFDVMRTDDKSMPQRFLIKTLRAVPILRLFGHMLTEGTMIVGKLKLARV